MKGYKILKYFRKEMRQSGGRSYCLSYNDLVFYLSSMICNPYRLGWEGDGGRGEGQICLCKIRS